jgi:hypothetical protein
VGIEIINYPVVAPHIWQLLDDMGRHWFSVMGTFLPFEIITYAI